MLATATALQDRTRAGRKALALTVNLLRRWRGGLQVVSIILIVVCLIMMFCLFAFPLHLPSLFLVLCDKLGFLTV